MSSGNLLPALIVPRHDSRMADYDTFAKFYDLVMGDRTAGIERVRRYIERYRPSAASLLELGCGTGAVAAGLAEGMRITGIDLSAEMLKVASHNVPEARFAEGDITAFSLGERFDVVICVFDTINHLMRFDLWADLFDRAHEHLVEDGLFVFDVNTIGRLRLLCRSPAWVADVAEHVMIIDVKPGADDDVSLWDIRIFEPREDDLFRLHRERISELGVPLAQIREALGKNFALLEEASPDEGPVTDESPRVFFACRNRLAPKVL
jgi:SAM-dependent methyltransferase